jgi:glycosyltransferase involved in cell wall biosynthesis
MKKVIVIDWLDKYGGSERVIRYLDQILNFDTYHTLINIMDKNDIEKITNSKPRTIIDTKLKVFGSKFRLLYFSFFSLIKQIKIDSNVEVIISSSHCVAKGIKKTNPNQIHISYFQARNNNYIWDEADLYLGKFKPLFMPLLKVLRKWDVKQAQGPDVIIANSIFVQNWVKNTYKRDSFLVYPPVDFSTFNFSDKKDDYYVAVGRLVQIKKFDIVIKAFNQNKKKLYIIGDGVELAYLKSITTNENIVFLGFLESGQINEYLKHAKGFIQMGIEGFGIAPVESQYCGTPVLAYAEGAVLETVIDKKTGIFFNEQDPDILNKAITDFEKINFDYHYIHGHAKQFSIENFKKNISKIIDNSVSDLKIKKEHTT